MILFFEKRHIITCVVVFVIYIVSCILIMLSFASLEPNEYGLTFNTLTAKIDKSRVYGGGLYFIGVAYNFRTFSAAVNTIAFEGSEAIDSASSVLL